VARMASTCWDALVCAPQRLAMPDFPEATSPALTGDYHVRAEHIVQKVGAMLCREVEFQSLPQRRGHMHDVPGDWFTGPF